MNTLGPDLQSDTEAAAVPGYIYVLSSPNCASLKIGRTDRLPPHRLREINANPVYHQHGPWSIVQVAQVTDTVAVETRIHRAIRSRSNTGIRGQKELFDVSIAEACKLIRETPSHDELTSYPKLARCFFDSDFARYLDKLYGLSGMSNFIDDQGAWTLSLFTSTAGAGSSPSTSVHTRWPTQAHPDVAKSFTRTS